MWRPAKSSEFRKKLYSVKQIDGSLTTQESGKTNPLFAKRGFFFPEPQLFFTKTFRVCWYYNVRLMQKLCLSCRGAGARRVPCQAVAQKKAQLLLVMQAKAIGQGRSPCAACVRRGGSLRGEAPINLQHFISAPLFNLKKSLRGIFLRQ